MNQTIENLKTRVPNMIIIRKELEKSDLEQVKRQASLLMKDHFIFNRAWDMEPSLQALKVENIDWGHIYSDDEEWTYMLNRFDYLKSLVIMSIVEKEDAYLLKAKSLMFDWIQKHPEINVQRSTRTLDTGIRILNFMDISSFLLQSNLLDEKELLQVKTSLVKQGNYLIKHYRPKDTLSNWGLLQTVALLFIYLNFDVSLEESYETILRELYHQLEIQILSDGIYWEQSTLYHGVVLEQILKLIQEFKTHQKTLSPLVVDKAESLADSLWKLTFPNGFIDAYGDSDRNKSSELLNKAAYVLSKEEYLLTTAIDPETILLFFRTSNLNKKDISSIFDGYASGVYAYRSGKSDQAHFTQFVNSSLGSAHGHGDHLHVSFAYRGHNILVDKGRFTYKESDFLRTYFKSSSAHNSTVINHSPMTLPTGSWSYKRYAKPLSHSAQHQGSVHYYKGSALSKHQGLELHQREMLVFDEGIWLIIDRIDHDGQNVFTQFFHFDPRIQLEMLNEEVWIKHPHVSMLYKNISQDNLKICKTPFSSRYNHKEGTYSLKIEGAFEQEKTNIHLFYGDDVKVQQLQIKNEHGQSLDYKDAIGLRLTFSSEQYYDIAIVHDERYIGNKNLYLNDFCFYGKVIVIETKNVEKNFYRFA